MHELYFLRESEKCSNYPIHITIFKESNKIRVIKIQLLKRVKKRLLHRTFFIDKIDFLPSEAFHPFPERFSFVLKALEAHKSYEQLKKF